MDLIALIGNYGVWAWVVGGILLLAIELIAPGGVFVWLGGAAIVTGLISLTIPMGQPLQWAVFGGLSVLGLVGWLALRRRVEKETDSPFLNRRAERHVGKEGFLSTAIVGQNGRMKLGDSVWRVSGPELPVGHLVRVVGNQGTVLNVESAESEKSDTN